MFPCSDCKRRRFSKQFALGCRSITWILKAHTVAKVQFLLDGAIAKPFFFIFPQDIFSFSLKAKLNSFFCSIDLRIFFLRLIITFLSCFPRIYPYVWRQFKREEWDDRKPRISIRISKWCELYLGDRCWRGEQDSYSFSVFRSGGRIWFFISLWWTSTSGQLQDKVRTHFLIQAHPKMWYGAQKWREGFHDLSLMECSSLAYTLQHITGIAYFLPGR